ncbi:hypothetical protein [Deinococcus misasensis]|uniref:hypothetical protein n=1 Tax=Deinococcus misasensis TaxID=392413 RepID=UPI000551E87D|nr:hypothetical protein [Deinococcus misasensis]
MEQNRNMQTDRPGEPPRDYVLVVTQSGDIETLRVSDISKVVAGPSADLSHVYVRKPESQLLRLTVVREPARAFQKRCDNLLAALEACNCDLINKFFAPPRVG